jgi:hypothetical protein
MPKTKGSKNLSVRDKLTNNQHPPEVQYDRLSPIDRLICFYYYIHIKTEGQSGWDIEKAGYKEHYDQFEAIYAHYSVHQFRHRGKVSSVRTALI